MVRSRCYFSMAFHHGSTIFDQESRICHFPAVALIPAKDFGGQPVSEIRHIHSPEPVVQECCPSCVWSVRDWQHLIDLCCLPLAAPVGHYQWRRIIDQRGSEIPESLSL